MKSVEWQAQPDPDRLNKSEPDRSRIDIWTISGRMSRIGIRMVSENNWPDRGDGSESRIRVRTGSLVVG